MSFFWADIIHWGTLFIVTPVLNRCLYFVKGIVGALTTETQVQNLYYTVSKEIS